MEIITEKIEPALNHMESTIVFYNAVTSSLNELLSKMPEAASISSYRKLLAIIESQKDLGIGRISSQKFIERMHDYSVEAPEKDVTNDQKDNTDIKSLIGYFLQENQKAYDLILSSFNHENIEQTKEDNEESLIAYLLKERQKAFDLILSSFSHEQGEELTEKTTKQSLFEYFLQENQKAYNLFMDSFSDDEKKPKQ